MKSVALIVIIGSLHLTTFSQSLPDSYFLDQSRCYYSTWFNNQYLNQKFDYSSKYRSLERNNMISSESDIRSFQILQNIAPELYFSKSTSISSHDALLFSCIVKRNGYLSINKNDTDINTLFKCSSTNFSKLDKAILYVTLTEVFGTGKRLIFSSNDKLQNRNSLLLFNNDLDDVFYNDTINCIPPSIKNMELDPSKIVLYEYNSEDHSIKKIVFTFKDDSLESIMYNKYLNVVRLGVNWKKTPQ